MQEHSNTYFYSAEDIKRYLSGNMSSQEMHDMERAALSDPMLADAIDGFRIADKNVITSHLSDISAKLLQSKAQHAKIVPLPNKLNRPLFRFLGAACVLAAIAGIWWLLKPTLPSPTNNLTKTINGPVDSIEGIAKGNGQGKTESFPVTDSGVVAVIQPKSNSKNQNAVVIPSPPKGLGVDEVKQAPTRGLIATPIEPISPSILSAPKSDMKQLNAGAAEKDAFERQSVPPEKSLKKFNYVQEKGPNKFLKGTITDENGKPVPFATIADEANKQNRVVTSADGRFAFPSTDSLQTVSITSVGYAQTIATLNPQKNNNIALTKSEEANEEVIVTGYGRQNRRKGIAADYNKLKQQNFNNSSNNSIVYPEDGWAQFYEELAGNLGIDKATASKTLQIKFTLDEDGEPTDFTIVESPDEILTKKAIAFIKKYKWKNFKLSKNAVVKISVN